MNKGQHGFESITFLLLATAGIISASGWLVYHSRHQTAKTSSLTQSHNPVLMIDTSRGGLCASGPCDHPVHHLYGDGTFEGHKKLDNAELSKLKNIIDTTDFLKYLPNTHKICQSALDGDDQVLIFPQKYGDQTFVPCTLNIPDNDPAFTYINKLLETH